MVNKGTGTGNEFVYEYNLKDHLGNNRVTFLGKTIAGGVIEVMQTSHYYPFGLTLSQNNYNPATGYSGNKYLYNGKELQDDRVGDTFFGMLDYGARFYDPQIGRWTRKDPLMEWHYNYSPYAYCFNNPVRLIDPDGLDAVLPDPDPPPPPDPVATHVYILKPVYCVAQKPKKESSFGGFFWFVGGHSDGSESTARKVSWDKVWGVRDLTDLLDLFNLLKRNNKFNKKEATKDMTGKSLKAAIETSDQEINEEHTGTAEQKPDGDGRLRDANGNLLPKDAWIPKTPIGSPITTVNGTLPHMDGDTLVKDSIQIGEGEYDDNFWKIRNPNRNDN